MRNRNTEIEKFCSNCGQPLVRKHFGTRIEDYEVFKKRKFCDKTCCGEYRKKTAKPKEPSPLKIAEQVQKDVTAAIEIENLTAVEFLRKQMNNPKIPDQYRIRCAELLAPYESPKIDSVKSGKKDQQAAKAGEIIKGARFGQRQPPRLVTGS